MSKLSRYIPRDTQVFLGIFPQNVVSTVHQVLAHSADLLRYQIYSIWLFTYSDIKTIIVPKTVFGALSALTAPTLGINPSYTPTPLGVSLRLPLTVFWVWINLLPFAIANQRHSGSIAEDTINKPWRVMPSGRMTPAQAKRLMLCLYAVAALVSWKIGGFPQCLALMALGFWYNDMRGAEDNCVVRNFINGLGYNCFATGATEVALGASLLPHSTGIPDIPSLHGISQPDRFLFWEWVALLVAVVTTTAHAQDIPDQAGDSIRGRKTVPLVIGDIPARMSIVVGATFWTIACCLFWGVGFVSYFIVGGLAAVVSVRVCMFRSARADKVTFLWWNGWITSVYMLPTLKMLL